MKKLQPRFISLLLLKRQAIGALIHGRIGFMGPYGDAIKRTILTAAAMIRALGHVAHDRTVFFTTPPAARLLSGKLPRECPPADDRPRTRATLSQPARGGKKDRLGS